MLTPPSPDTVDKIIENASKYNRGRQVRKLLDAALAFDRLDKPTREDIDKFKELFYSLIDQTPVADKRQISIILARNVYTPRAIALYLAMEDAPTASPVLLYSPLINEVDIVTIASKCDVLALRVLARRDNITTSMARAIIARRDPSSVAILRQNPSVMNSDAAQLLPPLEGRQATGSPRDRSEADPIPQHAAETRQEILNLAAKGGKLPGKRKHVTGIYTDSSGPPGDLLKAARSRNKVEFFNALSAQLGIGPAHLKKFILDDSANSLSAALRALEVPTGVASQIMLLMDPDIGTSIEKLRLFMKKFDALDPTDCRSRFIKAGGTFNHLPPETKRRSAPAQTSNSVESQLAAALRERRQAVSGSDNRPAFGRRHRAA